MGLISLHPGRLVVSRWPGDDDTVWPGRVEDLLPYLLHSLALSSDFTLGDLFHLLDRDDVALLATIVDERVLPVLEEARRGSVAAADGQAFHFLRVSNRHEDGHLRRELDAWGSWNQPFDGAEGKAGPRDTWMSVSLTPVGQLLDVPIRYDPELLFRNRASEIEYRTTVDITFVEFLKAVLYDLTFHGSPEERDQVLRDLKRQVEEIERGEVRMIPHEEVVREIRERLDLADDV